MTYHPQPTEVRIGVANYVGRDQINITNIDIESERGQWPNIPSEFAYLYLKNSVREIVH
jgi:hypothetical protein